MNNDNQRVRNSEWVKNSKDSYSQALMDGQIILLSVLVSTLSQCTKSCTAVEALTVVLLVVKILHGDQQPLRSYRALTHILGLIWLDQVFALSEIPAM